MANHSLVAVPGSFKSPTPTAIPWCSRAVDDPQRRAGLTVAAGGHLIRANGRNHPRC